MQNLIKKRKKEKPNASLVNVWLHESIFLVIFHKQEQNAEQPKLLSQTLYQKSANKTKSYKSTKNN